MTSDSVPLAAQGSSKAEAAKRGRKPAVAATPRYKDNSRARFVRLAEARTTKAVKAIEVIGNLANRAVYPSTPEDAAQIIGELRTAINKCEARFTNPETSKRRGFKLKL